MTNRSAGPMVTLADFAADPRSGRGRRFPEPESHTRTAFQRDRDRIIHSTAFRRLALKTQVFLPDEGDHFRTRLTHTIEVAQIARTITRALGLDDDLAEALALAHDLGHTPFGHTGEAALQEVMRAFGGFDHNAQTLRIVTLLERRYPAFDGLNLTWDTLEGLVKRHGPAPGSTDRLALWQRSGLTCFAISDEWTTAIDRAGWPSAEAQVAAVADDIAYNAHDVEDGLQAGLFALHDLDGTPTLRDLRRSILATDPGLDDERVIRAVTRSLVGLFVEDVIAESRRRLGRLMPRDVDDIRSHDEPVIALSPASAAASEEIKAFLFERMYRHPRLLPVRARAKRIVSDVAEKLLDDPLLLPPEWRPEGGDREVFGEADHARRVTDYVAGMTDRYVQREHGRLFDATPDLR